jgi:GntR family transcriptional regulator, rspAB operon transcriptional repressor
LQSQPRGLYDPGVLHPELPLGSRRRATDEPSRAASVRSSGAVGRGRLNDEAYHYIRDAILRGDYPTGTVLAETEIASTLGSSRTPVRHALGLLLREGLLEVAARRQVIVRGFTPERREEILMLREALESIAVGRACEVITDDDIDQLRLLIMRQRRAARNDEHDVFLELDEQFHLKIVDAAKLPILYGVLGQLRGFVRLARLDTNRPSSALDEVTAEHERIVDALERRDVELARAVLLAHLGPAEQGAT